MNKKLTIVICYLLLLLGIPGTVSAQKTKRKAESMQQQYEEQQRKYNYYYLEAARLKIQRRYAEAFDMLQHCLAIRPQASSALYEVAQYYLYLKQVPQAREALQQAVAGEPDNYWYCQSLVNLYLQEKETDSAIALLEEMAERFPSKPETLYDLLELYNRQEKLDKVLAILDKLEERLGKNEQITMEKFRIYRRKQDNEGAFREIEKLVSEYPRDMRYQVVLGDAYMQEGKSQEALDIYNKVLQEEPDNGLALYSLASYYEQTGQKELYEQQLDKLLLNKKVDSNTKLAVMQRFIVQNEQEGRDSTQVIQLFDRILETEPEDAQLPMLYAQYLASKKMTKETYPVLEQVIDIEPTNTAARMMLLGEAVRLEDYPTLIRLCEGGVEANPDMLEFYFYLAIGYTQAERTDEAIAICQKALTHVNANTQKEVISDFHSIIGDSYHSKGESDKAYAAYEEALRYNPSNISTLNNYAYYLSVERKELDKAEEMSYKTVKAEPNNATYLDTYAWILFEKGNYAEARIYIDDAMKNNGGESDVVVEHCGDIHYMTGDVEGALKYWKQALDMGSKSKTLKRKIQQKRYIRE